jgi:cyclophilin family peptidyl-prolyl cis-trans isomerase
VLALVAVLVVAAVALAAVLLDRGDGDAEADGDAAAAAAAEDADVVAGTPDDADPEPCPLTADSLPTPPTTAYGDRPVVDLDGADVVRATLTTTCGEIVLSLDAAAAPTTVANFVALAEDGYYEGVGFHRVIDDFMIQGGDPTGTGTGCVDSACATALPGYTFEDELTLAEQLVADTGGYPRGTVAMANRGADTNGSQFFIVQAADPYPLPPAYAAFGEVESGLDVVDRIALGPAQDELAIDPVVILSVDVQR